ncbi:amino acid adenylation domain-containing protein [Chitinophaga sancti]|uniref:non-ribosomal peptide synthetase n=1 Tax=Chitinophaga sancti TaxID=1004 RepID=UPI002A751F0E|nr:non-ribosomal peptide synthetase [Chitinophaga sancti]WPQ62330.1 amino acid adenylation domain-containing protein [Chitinophaga sancti]
MLEDIYPLSPMQQGLYYHWLNEPESHAYFSQIGVTIKGTLNIQLLEDSLRQLANRHAILRTFFTHAVGEEPLQVVRTDLSPLFDYKDLTGSEALPVTSYMDADRKQSFNLQSGSQVRLTVLKTAPDQFGFIWSHHHILMDGWCMRILIKEFFQIYFGLVDGKPAQLKRVLPYSNYIKWLNKEDKSASLTYWEQNLANVGTTTSIPLIDAGNSLEMPRDRKHQIAVSGDTRDAIRELCASLNVTENIFFQSLWGLLLSRYNNTNDVVFGAVVSGRPPELEGVEDMIGLFINTIPVRIQLKEEQRFSELLKEVQLNYVHGNRHHYVQLADIQAIVKPGHKLFDHILVYENYPDQPADAAAGKAGHSAAATQFAPVSLEVYEHTNFDFWIAIVPGASFTIRIHYNEQRYNEKYVKQIGDQLIYLLERIVANPDVALQELDVLNEDAHRQLLYGFNGRTVTYSDQKTVIGLFEEQVSKTPDAVAVIHGDISMTFGELNAKANALGNYLQKNYHIHTGDLVAIKQERSNWMITSVLAILKTGAAYLPLDPDYPQSRVDYIFNDSSCKLVVDKTEIEKFLSQADQYAVNNLAPAGKSTDLLYVIYTSGSTGFPKGCMVEQRGVINRLEWMWHEFGFSSADVILQKTNITFDVSVPEIFMPLCLGARMVLCPAEDVANPERLAALIAKNGVTRVHFVPSMMNEFIPLFSREPGTKEQLRTVRTVMASGEALSAATMQRWYEHTDIPVYNLYGPTEASIEVTCFRTSPADRIISIGSPIWNTRIYILGAKDRLVPIGVPGEICIGGDGVARGYLNNEALTSQKFTPDPFKVGVRIFRTGDTGRWLPDGQIEYLGRKDDQVKIRGFRIEPGEISHTLEQYPGIQAAFVHAQTRAGHEEKELVAYVISDNEPDYTAIRFFLKKSLPEYMVPSWYIRLDKFPLTFSGKIDRDKLLSTDNPISHTHTGYVAPRNAKEEKLVAIWRAVLGDVRISVTDDFFLKGGHSIKAIRMVAQIHKTFNVKVTLKDLFAHSVLEAQADMLGKAARNNYVPIAPVHSQEGYVLSSAQLRIYVLSQLDQGNVAYTMHGDYTFEDGVDLPELISAFNELIRRHEILRTVFRTNQVGEVRQFVKDAADAGFKITRFDTNNNEVSEAELTSGFLSTPFDLSEGPLIKAAVLQNSEGKRKLIYNMHHIIGDEWSFAIVIKELLAFYNAAITKKAASLSPLRIHFKDYAAWEQAQLNGDAINTHKAWWLKQFEGELPVLDLPADKPRPAERSYRGGVLRYIIPAATVGHIRQLNNEAGTTLFMSLLAMVNILLHRYSGQEDIVVGTVVTGRGDADLDDQIGCYLRTLPLRNRFNGNDNYKTILANVREVTLGAYEHQIYPFEALIEELKIPRDISRHPLIDVMLVLRDVNGNKPLHRVQEIYGGEESAVAKFDLLFEFTESSGGLQLVLEYNTDIYKKASVERMILHLDRLIAAAVDQPEKPVNQLPYLLESEKELLLNAFNDTNRLFPATSTMIDLFEHQVLLTPSAVAVSCKQQSISYYDLDKHSSKQAVWLQSLGIKTGSLVPVCMDRSIDMITGILGILKLGAAYVPIDPAFPKDRISYIINDCKAEVVLCGKGEHNRLFSNMDICAVVMEEDWVHIDALPAIKTECKAAPDQPAYVIYTSGSTGNPKGVIVEHAGMLNHLLAKVHDLSIDESTVIAFTAAFTFDISVWQMFAALIKGGQIVVFPDELIYEPSALIHAVNDYKVTILELVPSYLTIALDTDTHPLLDNLKTLLVTGEAVSRGLLSKWFNHKAFSHIPVVNAYGPTEASDDICHYFMQYTPDSINVPIGKPIQNTRIYILNPAHELCPVGIAGEICVAGIGVSRGYLNMPALTAERFVADPFGNGTYKMYKTGDIGRWLPDGNIEYLGRRDEQVKIHGYRIELGEVEHAMKECAIVNEAVAIPVASEGGSKRLVGYIVPNGQFDKDSILTFLRNRLPHYLVPSELIELSTLPLTTNGKLDKKALPVPGVLPEGNKIIVAARTETEEQLCDIWKEVLGRDEIGITENFFEAGGQSLKAIQMIARINTTFNVKVSIQSIFKDGTIENIAGQIDFLQEQHNQRQKKKELIQIEI